MKRPKASASGTRRRVDVARFGFDGPIDDNVKLIKRPRDSGPGQGADYPGAYGFLQARSYATANPDRPRTISRIVLHITDGRAKDPRRTAEFFHSGETTASAHYVVGQDGRVMQCVRERDIAFHAHDANATAIGIEHNARTRGELGASDAGMEVTDEQYRASARLVYLLCAKYDLPLHIAWLANPAQRVSGPVLGHHEADSRTTHTNCPEGKKGTSQAWRWDRFKAAMRKIHDELG